MREKEKRCVDVAGGKTLELDLGGISNCMKILDNDQLKLYESYDTYKSCARQTQWYYT